MDLTWTSANATAYAVHDGQTTAHDVIASALARIAAQNGTLNAFTAVTGERALARAAAVDQARRRGERLGPLAGVPFAVKNLLDIAGLPTVAGSKINRDRDPATHDSPLVQRLEAAGAVLVGALNMGEYAYDFTGENVHDGPARNPHDTTRMTGGSSSGSAGAVAGGLVPLSLGSDTNGSIRVPASLCGIFGLKPTYGRLSRARSFPFVGSLDHLGPFARSVYDLALAYDAMQGYDPEDPVCVDRAIEPTASLIGNGSDGLKIAIAGGYFRKGAFPEALTAVERVAKALGVTREIEIPEAARARAAAYVITATEGATLHLERLRTRANDFDPAVRDRLIAGAMVPATLVNQAQKFRRWYRARVLDLFKDVDAIIAPSTPCTAPLIGQQNFVLDGVEMAVRPNMGLYTQPISFIGLPVAAVPVTLSPLPIGVQIIAAPWREDIALRVAHALERSGVAAAPRPKKLVQSLSETALSSAHSRVSGNPVFSFVTGSPLSRGRAEFRSVKIRSLGMEIDRPEVVAEVTAAFNRYEQALVSNDVAVLDAIFRNDPRTIRYGGGENLYGYQEIEAFRAARSPVGLARTISKTVITAYGHDMAVASTLFHRTTSPGKVGRQMQTWVRFPDGWFVVAAHVSVIDEP
jgi:1-carboxybiuret hydrolase